MFRRYRRQRFVRGKPRLSDDEFQSRLGATSEYSRVIKAIRRVIATACGVPRELIHDSDRTGVIAGIIAFDIAGGWDELLFRINLEKELGVPVMEHVKLPPFTGFQFFFWRKKGPENFGVWCAEVARRIRVQDLTCAE